MFKDALKRGFSLMDSLEIKQDIEKAIYETADDETLTVLIWIKPWEPDDIVNDFTNFAEFVSKGRDNVSVKVRRLTRWEYVKAVIGKGIHQMIEKLH